MKVLLLNGSPHAKGSTFTALNEVVKSLEKEGIETEIIQIGNQVVRGCIGCNKCGEIKQCVFDDIVNEVAAKLEEADGLVIGSPVYYGSANGTLSAFLDRLFFSSSAKFDKTMKVGAAVVSARRGGNTATFDALNKYFMLSGMPVATSIYWNQIHGHNAEEALQDAEGLQTMSVLGRNMAFLIKSIALGKEKFGAPEPVDKIYTNFIR